MANFRHRHTSTRCRQLGANGSNLNIVVFFRGFKTHKHTRCETMLQIKMQLNQAATNQRQKKKHSALWNLGPSEWVNGKVALDAMQKAFRYVPIKVTERMFDFMREAYCFMGAMQPKVPRQNTKKKIATFNRILFHVAFPDAILWMRALEMSWFIWYASLRTVGEVATSITISDVLNSCENKKRRENVAQELRKRNISSVRSTATILVRGLGTWRERRGER